jgi:predicted RNase H-like HicB family nuclease
MRETIVFEINQEDDGGFIAECLSEDIFTEGDSWEELKENITEAVKAFYFDKTFIPIVKLHLVKNETLVIP